jgi:hypothetical protein
MRKPSGLTKSITATIGQMQQNMSQLNDYECFTDVGIYNCDPIPEGYKKIHVHLVYNVKHDGHHRACLVGDGHLTNVPVKSVYSGSVSLHGL